ncbi:MAG: MFS transporter [Chloroflexi bacterium]|nr:MFS transporter [Chloroflexota bacterium]
MGLRIEDIRQKAVDEATAYRWVVLALLVVVFGATISLREAFGVVVPFIQVDLGLDRAQIGLFFTATSIGTLLAVLTGQLADVLGVRRVLAIGAAAEGIAFLLIGAISVWPQALALALLAGVAYSSVSPAITKAIAVWFPVRVRGTAMGIKQSGVPLASMVAGATLPSLALAAGWRAAIAAVGGVMVASGLLTVFLYRAPRASTDTVAADQLGWRNLAQVLGNRNVLALCVSAALITVTHQTLVVYLVLYLHEYLGYSEVAAGFFLAYTQAWAIFGRLGWGVLSDRAFGGGRKLPLLLIAGITLAALLIAWGLRPGAPLWLVGLVTAAFGVSTFSWGALMTTLLAELAGARLTGTAAGVSQTISHVGIAVGPVLFGFIVDLAGYSWGWAYLLFCGVAGLVALLPVREQRRKE